MLALHDIDKMSRSDPNLARGLLYGYRKVDKGVNFQPTKVHLNVCFLFSHQPTSITMDTKYCNIF
jgi:hypothetical protein